MIGWRIETSHTFMRRANLLTCGAGRSLVFRYSISLMHSSSANLKRLLPSEQSFELLLRNQNKRTSSCFSLLNAQRATRSCERPLRGPFTDPCLVLHLSPRWSFATQMGNPGITTAYPITGSSFHTRAAAQPSSNVQIGSAPEGPSVTLGTICLAAAVYRQG